MGVRAEESRVSPRFLVPHTERMLTPTPKEDNKGSALVFGRE